VPHGAGYSADVVNAGLYSREEAQSIERVSDRGDRAIPLRRGT
jgi:hypothetical protein